MGASAAKAAIAPPGTPGVPILNSTLQARIVNMVPVVSGTPQADAKKVIMKLIRMDTASMLMVAPSGNVREAISSGTSNSSVAHLILIGRVAEEEQVPKAFKPAGAIFLKKATGLYFPINFTIPP